MYPPRKKCRKLLIWLSFAVVAQVMFLLLLREEFNLAPIRRSRTTKRMDGIKTRLKLQSRDFDETEEKHDLIARGIQEGLDLKNGLELKENLREASDLALLRKSIQNPLRVPRQNRFISMSTSLVRREDVRSQETVIYNHLPLKNSTKAVQFLKETHRDPSTTELQDVFISVKTTGKFHQSRVTILLDTWFQTARDQVYFFTETEDLKMNESLGGHLIQTPCEVGHQRQKLCCKMQAELDFFVHKSSAQWFCHFDDDNYVNVPTLVKTLQEFDPRRDLYFGKPSLIREMEAWDNLDGIKKLFWFATGGAGFCLSRALVDRMSPYISNGKFIQTCDRIKLPDDCTIGFIIESLLHVNLTKSNLFHSHLEHLPAVRQQDFTKQISLSHGFMGGIYNRVNINGPLNENDDPSRFKSVHCLLYPETSWCPNSDKMNNAIPDENLGLHLGR